MDRQLTPVEERNTVIWRIPSMGKYYVLDLKEIKKQKYFA